MYFFFHLTIKSPERPRWYHSAVFIGSPVYVLRITYRKASQILWSQWLFFCVLNNTHFFETSHRNQKNFMMSGKVGTFSKQSGLYKRYFFIMRILFTKLQSYSLCYRQTKWYMQNIPSVTGIICVKYQSYNMCM